MSRYSDEERTRIMAETYATLQRGDEQPPAPEHDLPHEDVLAAAMRRPTETVNQAARREIEAQQREYRRQRRARAVEAQSSEASVVETVEARLQTMRSEMLAEIATLRSDLYDVATASSRAVEQITDALDDLSSVARAPAKAANEHIEALLKRVEAKIDELNLRRPGDVIDMPNPLGRVN